MAGRLKFKPWQAALATLGGPPGGLGGGLDEGEIGIDQATGIIWRRPDGVPTGAIYPILGTQTGPTGSAGAAGSDGADSSVTGPTGPQGAASTVQGPQGAQGAQGPAGPQGAASTVQGPQGNQGPQGAQGPTGASPSGTVNINQFSASYNPSGYVILPNSVIIQWGQFTAVQGASASVALPIAYPHYQLQCVLTPAGTNSTNSTLCATGIDADSITYGWPSTGSGAEIVRFLSVGY